MPERGARPGNVALVAYADRVVAPRRGSGRKRLLRSRGESGRPARERSADIVYAPVRIADYVPPWYGL